MVTHRVRPARRWPRGAIPPFDVEVLIAIIRRHHAGAPIRLRDLGADTGRNIVTVRGALVRLEGLELITFAPGRRNTIRPLVTAHRPKDTTT